MAAAVGGQAPAWQAGTATLDITPKPGLWMAGFARRTQPAQGTALPLKAKALALQAPGSSPVVLVTMDLLGVTARMTDAIASAVQRRLGLGRSQLLFNASHTHCGPVVDEQLSVAYDLSPSQWADIRAYTAGLEQELVTLVASALSTLAPATVAWARGIARFARNRRVQFTPDGPVDHSVPVLRVSAPDGRIRAVVFGYACHNTTLQDRFVEYHGDYAGVAQARIERRHQGATALFVAGCGADANPFPRGTLTLVEEHGAALAEAVEQALERSAPIPASVTASYGTVDLPFADAALRERWRARLDIEAVYLRRYDALIDLARERGTLSQRQPAPIQVWRLGGGGKPTAAGVTLVAMGGEVVVDYALRLQREIAGGHVWVAGYSNDVFGYLPSARVLREGGYEGADAMVYYGRQGPFADGVEELIVGEVHRQLR